MAFLENCSRNIYQTPASFHACGPLHDPLRKTLNSERLWPCSGPRGDCPPGSKAPKPHRHVFFFFFLFLEQAQFLAHV